MREEETNQCAKQTAPEKKIDRRLSRCCRPERASERERVPHLWEADYEVEITPRQRQPGHERPVRLHLNNTQEKNKTKNTERRRKHEHKQAFECGWLFTWFFIYAQNQLHLCAKSAEFMRKTSLGRTYVFHALGTAQAVISRGEVTFAHRAHRAYRAQRKKTCADWTRGCLLRSCTVGI